MGACIRKRVVYDMSCKRFQFFVNVEALWVNSVVVKCFLCASNFMLLFSITAQCL